MSHYADEPYSVYRERVVKARKAHQCSACGWSIQPGDYYANVATVFDGKAETIKRCGSCQTTHKHLRKLCCDEDMWPDEKLGCGLAYENEWGGEPPEDIAVLPFLSGEDRSTLLAPKEHPHD